MRLGSKIKKPQADQSAEESQKRLVPKSAEELAEEQLSEDKSTPRFAAARAYARWLKTPARIDNTLNWALEKWNWENRDRRLFHEIMYGVIRWHGRIEWILSELSPRGVHTDQLVYAAAAIGVYQILYLDRIPIHAIVDSSAGIAKRAGGPSATAWVNAILRRIDEQKERWLTENPNSRDHQYNLSILYSFPSWMVARWDKIMDSDDLEQFLKWNNRRPRLILRINRLRADPTELVKRLKSEINIADPWKYNPLFVEVGHIGNLSDFQPLQNGFVSIQDASQGLVAPVVNPQKGENILDLCSAPGGKTGHLAEFCPECSITATDKDIDRLGSVKETIDRCGYKNVKTEPYQDVLMSHQRYHAVLVDAPCTGTGVIARRPDLRWRRKPDDVKRMASVQLQLLRYAADRVESGGRIVYSTCSVEPEENEGVIERFLSERTEFQVDDIQDQLPDGITAENGMLKIKGPEIDGDGVFVVRLIKKRSWEKKSTPDLPILKI